jgi:nitrogen fixation/metabolism regulation signal transduction histidine kinase
MTEIPRPPRRFRKRILAFTAIAGLLPVLTGAAVGREALAGFFALTLEPVDAVLGKSDLALAGRDEALRSEIAEVRLQLAQAELARRSLARIVPRGLGVAALVYVLVVIAALALVSAALTRPVERLVEGMARYARGDLAHRIPAAPGDDELSFLQRQFNRMGDELAAQRERLLVTEQIAAWQGAARTMAHDLKNPLTAMQMAVARVAKVADEGLAPAAGERLRESATLLSEQLGLLGRMAESFSEFAKLPPPSKAPVQLGPLCEEVCALWREAGPVPVTSHVSGAPGLLADADQLRRAVGNLVKNALEASVAGGEPVSVTAELHLGRARITVVDRGQGIGAPLAGAALSRTLGSSKRGGSGLGLPIVHKIVHDHGGTFRLDPGKDKGTVATIELPLSQPPEGA